MGQNLPGEAEGSPIPSVRVENRYPATPASGRAASNRPANSAERFTPVAGESGAAPAEAPAASAAAGGIEALIALQAVEDPRLKRRKAVQRGRSLLDSLEALRADLLSGEPGEGRLERMLAILDEARDPTDEHLDAIVDAIELRALVELAKRGRFPTRPKR